MCEWVCVRVYMLVYECESIWVWVRTCECECARVCECNCVCVCVRGWVWLGFSVSVCECECDCFSQWARMTVCECISASVCEWVCVCACVRACEHRDCCTATWQAGLTRYSIVISDRHESALSRLLCQKVHLERGWYKQTCQHWDIIHYSPPCLVSLCDVNVMITLLHLLTWHDDLISMLFLFNVRLLHLLLTLLIVFVRKTDEG